MAAESFTLNGVQLIGPAWFVTNLIALTSGPAVRGEDTIVPHAVGVQPNKRRVTATVKQLQMVVRGRCTPAGSPNGNQYQGVIDNVEELASTIGLGSTSGDGTVVAVWTRPDGSAVTFDCTVTRFEVAPLGAFNVNAVLEISVPAGALPAATP